MRPMGLGKKQPIYKDNCMEFLMMLSKAALADCVCDLLRAIGSIDMPVQEKEAVERLEPVLLLRGDKVPLTYRRRVMARGKKVQAKRIFDKAYKIATNQGGA